MWTEKYRPHSLDNLVGNLEARSQIMKWLSSWVHGKRPLLIIGPPGVGKTSFIHILSADYDYDLIEMNASDSRTRDMLESRILPILNHTSLYGKRMLLFVDEVDGIYRRQDTGGVEFLTRILREPTIPIVLAANSRNQQIKELIKNCSVIEFHSIPLEQSEKLLDQVLSKEGLHLTRLEKDSILKRSRGDMRSLLNIAQSALAQYITDKESIPDTDIGQAVSAFFAETSVESAKNVLAGSNYHYVDPRFGLSPEDRRRDILYAFFTSIISSRTLDMDTRADLLEILSSIDIWIGRIFQNRNWRLLRYLDDMLVGKIYRLSRNRGLGYSQYSFLWPTIMQVISRSQGLKSLITILSTETHTGKSVCGSVILPYSIHILSKYDNLKNILTLLDLDQKQASAIAKEMDTIQKHMFRTSLRLR
ncbi:MAG TPA: AAA family ATPase [Nitrososphaeraceae archaeon]|nr:AAA family ATPase [Nitrososphaeraceae archaeon]